MEVFVLKIRIKFAKRGSLKYVGHLDMLRYFQKLINRAKVDISYSEGFNPHQKMSFASPLGVGVLSEGEYVDIETNSIIPSEEMVLNLNEKSVDGIIIKSVRLLSDDAENAMSCVKASAYIVELRDGYELNGYDLHTEFVKFIEENQEINVLKQTKKSEVNMDIKPFLYDYKVGLKKDFLDENVQIYDDCIEDYDKKVIYMFLAAGSVTNIKPELLMEAFLKSLNLILPQYALAYTRLDVYGCKDKESSELISLEDFGTDILWVKL